jgi:hypothetical protein
MPKQVLFVGLRLTILIFLAGVLFLLGLRDWSLLIFALGWVIGEFLPRGEKLMSAALKLSEDTSVFYNLYSVVAVSILGLWLLSSSNSLLAVGLVCGLQVNLFTTYLLDNKKFSKINVDRFAWYWSALLLVETFLLLRR